MDCTCENVGRPADYNVSNSGLFLDQFSNIRALINGAECDKTLWDILVSSRKAGVSQFVKDTNLLLSKKYRMKRRQVTGHVLGQIKSKDTITPTKNYAVISYVCANVKSGYMTFKNIGTIFEAAGAISLDLYNNVDGFLQTIPLNNTLVNKHAVTGVDITLPLHSKYVKNLEYYFVYQFDGANRPKDNQLDCGCGGWTPKYNLASPYFENIGTPKNAPWSDYVMVGGGQINSLSELTEVDGLDGVTFNNDFYGLTFEVSFNCIVNEVVCKDALDFEGNQLALGVAFAILYGTAANMAGQVLSSSLIEREVLVNTEDWELKQIEWTELYNQHVNTIVNNANIKANDCLECKDVIGMTRKGLFA